MKTCNWTITFADGISDNYGRATRESFRLTILDLFPTRSAVICYYQHETAMQQLEIRCQDELRLTPISQLVNLTLVKSVVVEASKPVEEGLGAYRTPEGVGVCNRSTTTIRLDNNFGSKEVASFDSEL